MILALLAGDALFFLIHCRCLSVTHLIMRGDIHVLLLRRHGADGHRAYSCEDRQKEEGGEVGVERTHVKIKLHEMREKSQCNFFQTFPPSVDWESALLLPKA